MNKKREASELNVRVQLRVAFHQSRGTYGRPRLTAALRQQGLCINEKRVYRLMKEEGLQARPAPTRVSTTDSNHAEEVSAFLWSRIWKQSWSRAP